MIKPLCGHDQLLFCSVALLADFALTLAMQAWPILLLQHGARPQQANIACGCS